MSLKDNWKETGKELGSAFKGLGKNVVKSAKVGLDSIDEDTVVNEDNVFNDGSWRKTGKEMGSAFKDLGKTIVKSAKAGIDKIDTED